MIIVTGGAGFIGSNIVHGLNVRGITDILVVDNLTDGHKCLNLSDAKICDYMDKNDFLSRVKNNQNLGSIEAVYHQGACSATTQWDGRMMMQNNYDYSKCLLHWCVQKKIPFYYASSASVYGAGSVFKEDRKYEHPLNAYAFSKFQFDAYLRTLIHAIESPVVGLRYFNVYGPREKHKGSMASVAYHLYQQLKTTDKISLFEGSDGYAPGCQERDFIYVDDVVSVNLWFLENPHVKGIFNCGTGRAQSFNAVAYAVIAHYQRGEIDYIDFPVHLKGHYQSYTQADITALRTIGYKKSFFNVEQGVQLYMTWLDKNSY